MKKEYEDKIIELLTERNHLLKEHNELLKIINLSAIDETLIIATKNANIEAVKVALKHGADVNVRDKDDLATPLIIASKINNKDLVEILLDYGADKNLTDEEGWMANIYAKENKCQEIIDLLSKE